MVFVKVDHLREEATRALPQGEAHDLIAWGVSAGVSGGEHRAGEIGAGGFGKGHFGGRPQGEVHELDIDGVEGAGVDTDEEVVGGGGGGCGDCAEVEGRGVAAVGVGPGADLGGGGGCHGVDRRQSCDGFEELLSFKVCTSISFRSDTYECVFARLVPSCCDPAVTRIST